MDQTMEDIRARSCLDFEELVRAGNQLGGPPKPHRNANPDSPKPPKPPAENPRRRRREPDKEDKRRRCGGDGHKPKSVIRVHMERRKRFPVEQSLLWDGTIWAALVAYLNVGWVGRQGI